MKTGARLDNAAIDTVLTGLLSLNPPARVYKMSNDGFIVTMPAAGSARQEAMPERESLVELLVLADMPALVAAWETNISYGTARVTVHLADAPEHEVAIQLVDARHRFGVFLAFITGYDGPIGDGSSRIKAPLFEKRSCVIERDGRGIIRAVDAAACELLGYRIDELVGLRTLDLIHPDDQAPAILAWMTMLRHPGSYIHTSARYRHKDGRWIWFGSTSESRLNDPSNPHISTELIDITDQIAAKEALRAGEQVLSRLMQALPVAVVQIDAQRRIVRYNERLDAIAGPQAAPTIDDQLSSVVASDRPVLEAALSSVLRGDSVADVEVALLVRDARRHCSVAMRALTAESGAITGAIVCIADISENVRFQHDLQSASNTASRTT